MEGDTVPHRVGQGEGNTQSITQLTPPGNNALFNHHFPEHSYSLQLLTAIEVGFMDKTLVAAALPPHSSTWTGSVHPDLSKLPVTVPPRQSC